MGSSRKQKLATSAPDGLDATVEAILRQHLQSGARVCAALSGGVDSVVLVDLLARLRRRLDFRLSAVHVNHGLSPNAAQWAEFCTGLCRRRRIPLSVEEVRVERAGGESLEERARAARHQAFSRQDADFVALAHNRDDQAETLLLQLLRGAGVKGLAAMPVVRGQDRGGSRQSPVASRQRGASDASLIPHPSSFIPARIPHPSSLIPPKLLRPLLGISRAEIEAYARQRGLEWVEDESNADTRFDRNFLRRHVLPALESRFPGCRSALARTGRHLAEASELLDCLAAADAATALDGAALKIDALRDMGAARAKNLLRHLIERRGGAMPGEALLEEGLRQLLTARRDARVLVALDGLELRRHAGLAFVEPACGAKVCGLRLEWRGEKALDLGPGLGRLVFRRARGRGLSLARLASQSVTVRTRRGGEWLRPDPGRPRRTLKNLFQEAGIPHWERERTPLLCCAERLAWVAGIGTDADFRCQPGEPGLEIRWERE